MSESTPPHTPTRSTTSSSQPQSSSVVDTPSLLQSAAKFTSKVDTSSGLWSDEETEYDDNGTKEAALDSLKIETLPAMPSEQDRKRFVGCLAAVLASSYDWDCREADDINQEEALLYMDMNEREEDDEEQDSGEVVVGGSSRRPLHRSVSDSFELSDSTRPYNKQRNNLKSQKIFIARGRIRKRRYDILSDLLLSSAEYMRVEKSQAKAFLPMLAKVLAPDDASKQHQQSQHDFQRPPRRRTQTSSPRKDSHEPRSPTHHHAEDHVTRIIDSIEHLRPFLDLLGPGAGFRCLAIFLIQHLLHSETGYDARVRHAVKTLGVILLMHDMERDPVDVFYVKRKQKRRKSELVTMATRKFESLEHTVARKLILLSSSSSQGSVPRSRKDATADAVVDQGLTREDWIRGLKIGGTAVVAGTLFAVTGGLAAPGIAGAIAAIPGLTAATAAAAGVLTSTAAVTAIFGVGGGSLAAYKMQRRTQGLTEFRFNKESGKHDKDGTALEAELFSTICLSGWLRDRCDFQRPWGVLPSDPCISDRVELLERFYSVHKPSHVNRGARILEQWKGEEDQLWKLLEQKYGKNPDTLFPFEDGQRYRAALTLEQREVIDELFVELGCETPESGDSGKRRCEEGKAQRKGYKKWSKQKANKPIYSASLLDSSFDNPPSDKGSACTLASVDATSFSSSGFESIAVLASNSSEANEEVLTTKEMPDHIATVWDFEATYGGELYTVTWESELLIELCDSVADLAFELVSGGTAQLLRHTALSTLLSAFAWPYALVNAANMIDGTWTLAVERADDAGKELARSLLFSSAGHRPVTLVGFSFGARTVYSCLKELARWQELWENEQERIREAVERVGFRRYKGDSTFANMREPASIVEDAVLMGLPNHLSLSSWKACRQAVSGRLINCYSQKDLILSLMFQIKKFGGLKPVCGVCPVNCRGVENVDITDLVSGHRDYCFNIGAILNRIKLGNPFPVPHKPSRRPADASPNKMAENFSKLDI